MPIVRRGASQASAGSSGSEPRAQRWGVLFLGLVAVASVTAVVLIVLHRSTSSSTAAITALSTLGSAAVGGIAGMLTSSSTVGPSGSRQRATLTLSATSGAQKSVLTVSGSGFGPGEPVNITFGSTSLTGATADANANFTLTQNVPDVPAGPYIVTATGQITSATAMAAFNVTA